MAEETKTPHKWEPSWLGHAIAVCAYCHRTDREIAVIGDMNHCEKAPHPQGSASRQTRDAPVAWRIQELGGTWVATSDQKTATRWRERGWTLEPLYLAPALTASQARQRELEEALRAIRDMNGDSEAMQALAVAVLNSAAPSTTGGER